MDTRSGDRSAAVVEELEVGGLKEEVVVRVEGVTRDRWKYDHVVRRKVVVWRMWTSFSVLSLRFRFLGFEVFEEGCCVLGLAAASVVEVSASSVAVVGFVAAVEGLVVDVGTILGTTLLREPKK